MNYCFNCNTIFWVILFFTAPVNAAIPAQEREALIALYHATNGDNWTDNWSWLGPEGSECNWVGVVCQEGNHVNILALGKHNLNGTIPSQLSQLTELKILDLNTNHLTGSIPAELGQLSHLTMLTLSENELTGSIPSELGQLTHLTWLSLFKNRLSGSIPSTIGQLSKLSTIWLSENLLSGAIPIELANLNSLQALFLRQNAFTGHIPKELGNLSHLTDLDLRENQLSGTIPTELGQLSKLNWLFLANNKLTGPIPSEFANLVKLKALVLNHNRLSGSIPSELGKLTNLIDLNLGDNQLNGSIPSELGQLRQVFQLLLENNDLDGVIPEQLSNLKRLKTLFLSGNCFAPLAPELSSVFNKIDYFYLNNRSNCPEQVEVLTAIPSYHEIDSSITIPAIKVFNKYYDITLIPHIVAGDSANLYFKIGTISQISAITGDAVAVAQENYDISFKKFNLNGEEISATLDFYVPTPDSNALIWKYDSCIGIPRYREYFGSGDTAKVPNPSCRQRRELQFFLTTIKPRMKQDMDLYNGVTIALGDDLEFQLQQLQDLDSLLTYHGAHTNVGEASSLTAKIDMQIAEFADAIGEKYGNQPLASAIANVTGQLVAAVRHCSPATYDKNPSDCMGVMIDVGLNVAQGVVTFFGPIIDVVSGNAGRLHGTATAMEFLQEYYSYGGNLVDMAEAYQITAELPDVNLIHPILPAVAKQDNSAFYPAYAPAEAIKIIKLYDSLIDLNGQHRFSHVLEK